ncbi:class III signal peptide-containing protein [Methanobrevibacter sp. TMH8]|uniref:class III signal peptide-containing protein n=1 Tax=Methanobrevibacter sp. TMH8 TaxID=2848611 RepID=UPI001CCD2035|nr:class III signal peptide-containing protein [Methanobrevibacter sp. TMH8]
MNLIENRNMKIFNDKNGQISAEMILLIGTILIIVILAGNYIFKISDSINSSLLNLIEKVRDSILYKI